MIPAVKAPLGRLAFAATLVLLAACSQDQTMSTAPNGAAAALAATSQGSGYIVVFSDDVADPPGLARALTAAHGSSPRFTYSSAIKGFAANLSDAAVEALRRNPNVAYVEPDAEVQLHDTQTSATWGLDRIDQRDLPINTTYTYGNNGSGVNVYILDTGIRLTHTEFGGRAAYVDNGFNGNFVGDGRTADDCNGHGTHVAGTVGGAIYGVAKGVNLFAARVVNCRGGGTASMAIAAVDWVTTNAVKPAVVNMSLGYGTVQSLTTAVQNSVAAGIVYAVSAGNGNFWGQPLNACTESPANAAAALTVGATSSTDREASWSNYGPCVDILAPGVSVTSAWKSSDTQTNTISGTSMSSPHVAGAAAQYLSANPSASPSQVANALTSNASANKITLHSSSASGGTPNKLLYVGFIGASSGGGGGGGGGGGEDPPPPGNASPTAAFTFSCTFLACSFDGSGSDDSDGTIVNYSWTFGDGSSASGATPSHTYGSGGSKQVRLTVTDDDGATGSVTKTVVVNEPPPTGFVLSATGYRVKGAHHADLTWTGSEAASFDVKRDGVTIASGVSGSSFTDAIGKKGGASYTYQVCESGGGACTQTVTVVF